MYVCNNLNYITIIEKYIIFIIRRHKDLCDEIFKQKCLLEFNAYRDYCIRVICRSVLRLEYGSEDATV